MKAPKLKPIDLRKCCPSKREPSGLCDHPDINSRSQYLAKIGSELFIGRFSHQRYGWSFDGWGGGAGLQLDMPGTNSSDWKALWQIKH